MKQAEGAQHVEIKKARASCMERQAKGYRFNGRDPYRFKNTGGSRDKTKQKRTDRSCVSRASRVCPDSPLYIASLVLELEASPKPDQPPKSSLVRG